MQSDLLSLDEAINKIRSSFQKISNEDIFLKDVPWKTMQNCIDEILWGQTFKNTYDFSLRFTTIFTTTCIHDEFLDSR